MSLLHTNSHIIFTGEAMYAFRYTICNYTLSTCSLTASFYVLYSCFTAAIYCSVVGVILHCCVQFNSQVAYIPGLGAFVEVLRGTSISSVFSSFRWFIVDTTKGIYYWLRQVGMMAS